MVDDWRRQSGPVRTNPTRGGVRAELVVETEPPTHPRLAVRGPVFGLAVLDPAAGPHWRLETPVMDGTPQQSRDALNSLLWFRARDDARDPAVRRELLAAVAVLEHQPVNELEVLGCRYRVVRADEWARFGPDGLEPPRPTDREPDDPSWEDRRDTLSADPGFTLRPDAADSASHAHATRLGLRVFAYTGSRFPAEVRRHSEQAVTTHPDIAQLPVGFGVIEREESGWSPHGPLMPTPHDARRLLYGMMARTWPLIHGFDEQRAARYGRAAQSFREAGTANELTVEGRLLRLCRIERMVRCGPDGPEPPRPSDHEMQEPMKMHPGPDESGALLTGE